MMKFERKVKNWYGSVNLVIPKDVVKLFDLTHDTDIILTVQEGKKGQYIAIWRKDADVELTVKEKNRSLLDF